MAGTSGKVRLEGDDDAEGASTEQQGAAIREALGMDTRNKVRLPRLSDNVWTALDTSMCIDLPRVGGQKRPLMRTYMSTSSKVRALHASVLMVQP